MHNRWHWITRRIDKAGPDERKHARHETASWKLCCKQKQFTRRMGSFHLPQYLVGGSRGRNCLPPLVLLLDQVEAVKVASPEHLMAHNEGHDPGLQGST